jgi:hypothetical protein
MQNIPAIRSFDTNRSRAGNDRMTEKFSAPRHELSYPGRFWPPTRNSVSGALEGSSLTVRDHRPPQRPLGFARRGQRATTGAWGVAAFRLHKMNGGRQSRQRMQNIPDGYMFGMNLGCYRRHCSIGQRVRVPAAVDRAGIVSRPIARGQNQVEPRRSAVPLHRSGQSC